MDPFVEMLLWTTLAGACIPIGAGLAHIEHFRSQWLEQEFRHFVIAFGGGVLVGAVALVLVPEGAERLPEPLAVAGLMLAGGGAFMMIDRIQARAKQATPQFTAMAADFLPESLALGGMFAANPEGGVLLARLCCKLGEGAMRDQGASCSPYDSALARRSCSHAMASVRAHGPRPKARSTIRASPTMPP